MKDKIGCIVMASGLSVRYGKNKLLEKLGDREVILHTVSRMSEAGLSPLTVTRSSEVQSLLEKNGFSCILHDLPLKSDTMHIGLSHLGADAAGYLFVPGDQPLVMPETIRRLVRTFKEKPDTAIRLGFHGTVGSPVLFPASLREALLSYEGDRGGLEVLRKPGISCDVLEASYEWELWDVDTPESMEKVRDIIIS